MCSLETTDVLPRRGGRFTRSVRSRLRFGSEGVREGLRTYRVWGKADLDDAAWSEVAPDCDGDFRFFRVTVEMP